MNVKKMGLMSAVGFTALVTASLATNVMADGHKNGNGMHDSSKMADRLAHVLELDDATKAEVTTLLEKNSLEMKTLRESHKTQLEALLTPEQVEKLQKMKKHRGKHGKYGKEMKDKMKDKMEDKG
ncbi:hypothetical protein [Marinomonas sp. 2405UD68-3]|uniref:hypothetical protein n=1 Tax=Marinomonas sp. 2405UD68-3 TaxID=3391835 RepID=UPI0039C966B1